MLIPLIPHFFNKIFEWNMLRLCCRLFAFLALFGCAKTSAIEYSGCGINKDKIYTIKVPNSYKPQFSRDASIDVKERAIWTVWLYATYPNYEGFQEATLDQIKQTEQALVNTAIPTMKVFISGGTVSEILKNYARTWDELPIENRPQHRYHREESDDANFWLYVLADRKSSKDKANDTAYWSPKGSEDQIFFECGDFGNNELPKKGRCYAHTKLVNDVNHCVWINYRIPTSDLLSWREVDSRIKNKISNMIKEK